jgi:hypothetical protein
MLLPEHNFLVESVSTPQKTKDQKHDFQTIVLNKPGWTDDFGDKKGRDDLYQCKAWNKTIAELPVLKRGDKVSAMLNLQGRQSIGNNGSEYFNLELSIKKLKLL